MSKKRVFICEGFSYNWKIFFDVVNNVKTPSQLRKNNQSIIEAEFFIFFLKSLKHVVDNYDDTFYNPSLPNYSHDSH